jgi:small subunit ribosomal protein S11
MFETKSCRSLNDLFMIVRQLLRSTFFRRPRLIATYANGPYGDFLEDLAYHSPPAPPPGSFPIRNSANPITAARQLKSYPKSTYQLHVFSSKNNTITTFTKPNGDPISWSSAGSCGFRKSQRSGYEAGYQCAVKMFQKIEDYMRVTEHAFNLELLFKGFGQGRDALQKALLTVEGENIRNLIIRLTDRTPIKIGGTRAKKARRL